MVGHAIENSLTMSEATPGPSVISMHRMSSYVKFMQLRLHAYTIYM